jgi:hypothetical protein
MHQLRALDIFLEETPAARALALELVTRMELLRLKVIARLHARGLPPEVDWSDLLQEAISRVLDGSRPKPGIRNNMSKTDYDSTRKRMRRALIREGLRRPQP